MAIINTDIVYRLSGGAANSDPLLSLGGAKSSVVVPSGHFDTVDSAGALAGQTEYRCLYVHNAHATLTMLAPKIWIQTNTTGSRIAIGLGTSALNATETAVGSETTAPTSVTFSQPTNEAGGIALSDIPPGQSRAVWLRRTVAASTAANSDAYTLRVKCDSLA